MSEVLVVRHGSKADEFVLKDAQEIAVLVEGPADLRSAAPHG